MTLLARLFNKISRPLAYPCADNWSILADAAVPKTIKLLKKMKRKKRKILMKGFNFTLTIQSANNFFRIFIEWKKQ